MEFIPGVQTDIHGIKTCILKKNLLFEFLNIFGNFMRISTIFFDLGSTLIYARDPWGQIFSEAESALLLSLKQDGIELNNEAIKTHFGGFIESYYADRGNTVVERTSFSFLKGILESKGFSHVPGTTIRKALDAMYSITQLNWYLEEDAISVLNQLLELGFQIGLISNTSDDRNVQQLIDKCGLRPFFKYIITSAGCGIRKPDRQIFQSALDYFHITADESVMIGDTLEADILGANQLGMYSIWIIGRVNLQEIHHLDIQPQAVVSSLAQIPALISDILAS